MTRTNQLRLFILLLLAVPRYGQGLGAWFKSDPRPGFDFLIQKFGIFSQSGHLKVVLQPKPKCESPVQTAWVTHRLKPNEPLTARSAKLLALQLNKTLASTCFSEVELDIEPMPHVPFWLADFLKEIRSHLALSYRIRMAIPPVSHRHLPGLRWTPEEARSAIEWLDGLDFMIYDSGASSKESYQQLIHETMKFVEAMVAKFPEKTFVLGLPTYKDKTRLHLPSVENLHTAVQALYDYSSRKILCLPSVRIAFYAGWTMNEGDKKLADEFKRWRANGCA